MIMYAIQKLKYSRYLYNLSLYKTPTILRRFFHEKSPLMFLFNSLSPFHSRRFPFPHRLQTIPLISIFFVFRSSAFPTFRPNSRRLEEKTRYPSVIIFYFPTPLSYSYLIRYLILRVLTFSTVIVWVRS